MAFNKKAHLLSNIEAIRIAFTLDQEKRQATDEERAALQKYCGFGGIKCILKSTETEKDRAYWNASEIDMFPMVADLHKLIRDNSKDDREYKQYFDSLKNSILTAFYTPPEAIKAISNTLKANGISPHNFLEPSAGSGAFVDTFKDTFSEIKVAAFEKDLLTGKILSHLHPKDRVHIRGFEEIENRPDNQFDVIASNIPFGDVRIFDPAFTSSPDQAKRQAAQKVHNYFFLKSIDHLREGGLLAFITSQGIMNSPQNEPVREWLMKNTNLVSAVRLPNNLFTENAGTEAGSDLIILQKNTSKTSLTPDEEAFLKCRTLSNGITINNYFQDFSRVVQTKGYPDTDLYGKQGMIFLHEGGIQGMASDLQKMLSEDFSLRLDKELYMDNIPVGISLQTKDERELEADELFREDMEEIDAAVEAIRTGKWDAFVAERPYINGVTGKQDKVEQYSVNPVMSLYDLFGLTEEERKQVNTTKKRKKSTPASNSRQLDLFSTPPVNTPITPAKPVSPESPNVAPSPPAQKPPELPIEPRPYSGSLQEHHKQGSMAIDNNQIGVLQERYRDDAVFRPLKLNSFQEQKAKMYIQLRDAYHTLYNYEAAELKENAELRKIFVQPSKKQLFVQKESVNG